MRRGGGGVKKFLFREMGFRGRDDVKLLVINSRARAMAFYYENFLRVDRIELRFLHTRWHNENSIIRQYSLDYVKNYGLGLIKRSVKKK